LTSGGGGMALKSGEDITRSRGKEWEGEERKGSKVTTNGENPCFEQIGDGEKKIRNQPAPGTGKDPTSRGGRTQRKKEKKTGCRNRVTGHKGCDNLRAGTMNPSMGEPRMLLGPERGRGGTGFPRGGGVKPILGLISNGEILGRRRGEDLLKRNRQEAP